MHLVSRRELLIGTTAAVVGTALFTSAQAVADDVRDTVNRVDCEFQSGGDVVRGTLFTPSHGIPAATVVFSGPMTSVKEQSAGVYATALARRGFAALAFDHRYFGASGGQPRQLEDPEAKVADIRSAVTTVSELPQTRDRPVVALGLCIGSAYMARAVADDSRVAAFASVAGAFVSPERIRAAMGPKYDEQLVRASDAQSRWETTGIAETIPAVGVDGDVAMPAAEAYSYYGTTRAGSTYVNGFAVQSWAHTLPFDSQSAASGIDVPTLVVHSANATFPEEATRFLAGVAAPKQELWLDSAGQVDFYDDPRLVNAAADAAAAHFTSALR